MDNIMRRVVLAALLPLFSLPVFAQSGEVDRLANEIESEVISWRHHLHEYPELSNREFKTAEYVARHLRSLNLEV